jgi:hypothetical protein
MLSQTPAALAEGADGFRVWRRIPNASGKTPVNVCLCDVILTMRGLNLDAFRAEVSFVKRVRSLLGRLVRKVAPASKLCPDEEKKRERAAKRKLRMPIMYSP